MSGSRGFRFFVDLMIATIIWYFTTFWIENFRDDLYKKIMKSIPGTMLIYFGCYSLYSIGHGLYILKDCPEEYELLKQDIDRARTNLKSKGMKL